MVEAGALDRASVCCALVTMLLTQRSGWVGYVPLMDQKYIDLMLGDPKTSYDACALCFL